MELPRKISPLRKLVNEVAKNTTQARKIPREKILLEKAPEAVDNGMNISNSSVTININIDASGLNSMIQDVSKRATKLAAGMAGIAALGAAAALLGRKKKAIVDPHKVKLPPVPEIKLPKI